MWQEQFQLNTFAIPKTANVDVARSSSTSTFHVEESSSVPFKYNNSSYDSNKNVYEINEYLQQLCNRSSLLSLPALPLPSSWHYANLTQMPEMPPAPPPAPSSSLRQSRMPLPPSASAPLIHLTPQVQPNSGRTSAAALKTAATEIPTTPLSDLLLSISKSVLPYLAASLNSDNMSSSLSSPSSSSSIPLSATMPATTVAAAVAAAAATAVSAYDLEYLPIDLLTDIFVRLNASLLRNEISSNNNGNSNYNYTSISSSSSHDPGTRSGNNNSSKYSPLMTSHDFLHSTSLATLPRHFFPPSTLTQPMPLPLSPLNFDNLGSMTTSVHSRNSTLSSTLKADKLLFPMANVANIFGNLQQQQHEHEHYFHQHQWYHQQHRYGGAFSTTKTKPTAVAVATTTTTNSTTSKRRCQALPLFERFVDAEMSRKSHDPAQSSRQTAELFERSKCCRKSKAAVDGADIDLLPPPKKKWIRHYLKEDELSSPITTPNAAYKLSPNSKSPAFFLLASSNNPIEQQQEQKQQLQFQHEQQQQQKQQFLQQQQQQQQSQHHQHNENNQKLKSFTQVNVSNASGNVAGVVASKQMLLNGGRRVATNTSIINIPNQQQHHQPNITSKLLATSSPSTFSLHGSVPRYKSAMPLTPPPSATRKLSEPYSRIRSTSLTFPKISANQMMLQSSGGSGNSSNSSSHMIVDDPPHLGGGSNHSPPRHGGSHYMQMMSSAQHQGSQGSHHHMTPLGSSGRRRTISSNSNGAGTREVHNILEKNRRAILKGCYEELKNVLQLKDEDRSKKTSNLAVLNEALVAVKAGEDQQKKDEIAMEKLGKEKIALNKRIVNLKRDLGPKYEKIFASIFPEGEFNSIPSERDNVHDTASLSSGRGSALYSSSSSLSSGGSSNIMFSPVGAGQLQTATPTAISPVITKINNNNNNSNSTTASTTNITNIHNHSNSISTVPLTDSPNGLPLALAATNITRGSPTPSTPSPSPSSSSGVSSSSSLISSSPPGSGVISNGRSVTVNIPFQTNSNGATIGTIGNGTASAAATIIATSPPTGNSSKANNAQAAAINVTNHPMVTTITTSINNNQNHNINSSSMSNGYRRKTCLSIGDDTKATITTANINDYEDVAQQPAAKFFKVYNGLVTTDNGNIGKHTTTSSASSSSTALSKNVATGSLQLSQVVGGGSLVVSPTFINAVTAGSGGTIRTQKILMNGQNNTKSIVLNGSATSNELGRLPGGAELNILPSNSTSVANGGNGGIKLNNSAIGSAVTTPTTAFYNSNGKLTLVNGGAAVGVGGNNGILLKEGNNLVGGSTAAITPIIVSTATSNVNNGSGIHNNTSANFAQLLAATSMAASGQAQSLAGVKTATSIERLNGKFSLSVGGQAQPRINAQYTGAVKSVMITTALPNPTEHATLSTIKSNNNIIRSGTAFSAAKRLKTNSR